MESRHRRGQLDGWKQTSTTGGEHGQHPVLAGHGNNVAEEEGRQMCTYCIYVYRWSTGHKRAFSPTCSLQPWPPSSAAVCSSPAHLSSIAAGWVLNLRPQIPRCPPPGRQMAPCWPEHSATSLFITNKFSLVAIMKVKWLNLMLLWQQWANRLEIKWMFCRTNQASLKTFVQLKRKR